MDDTMRESEGETINDFVFTTSIEVSQHGRGTYYLVMVPQCTADILSNVPVPRGGFGSIKCEATIGDTTWSTSVFPSYGVFVLLIAKKIIEAENLCIGDQVEITLSIREPHAGGAGFTNEQTEHDDIC